VRAFAAVAAYASSLGKGCAAGERADNATEAEMLSSARVQQRLTQRALALILAGGRGSRLKQLTDRRAKPAVFFGGKFRIIDFALSNCLNSGLRRIAVLTQYKAHSLLRHLQMGWSFLRPEMNEFLDLLPAQQRLDEATWYRGTTDAVYQNFDIFRAAGPRYFVVLAGDHIYKMDYSNMLADHVDNGADCTVACIEVPLQAAGDFGIMAADPSMRIVDFLEKPKNPPAIQGKPDRALASMGVYVFTADFLYSELERDHRDPTSSHDFGRDLIPNLVARGLAMAHSFEDSCVKTTPGAEAYWRDVGTIDAYWAANLDLVRPTPSLDIYDPNWPIWTYQQQLPPAKFIFDDDNRRGMAVDSMVSGGCIISGATVRRSLLFSSVRVNSFARTTEAVLLPEVDVGRHARLSKVVVDRGVHIPEGLVIGADPDLDARRFTRSGGGISLVTAEMLAALG
jgi:glucose-1-phosphate adenylyltransferase